VIIDLESWEEAELAAAWSDRSAPSLFRESGIASVEQPGHHWVRGDVAAGIVVGGRMSEPDAAAADGLGLAEAIGLLRDELLRARAAGASSDIQLPVESMTVELTVTASRSLDGKVGFTVPVVGLQLGAGGARGRGSEQKVTVVFGGPVDRAGNSVKVAQPSAERKE
jgi:hypothetical protein